MKSILIIAPWLGIVNRGAETFSRELAVKLAQSWKVSLVTGSKVDLGSAEVEQIDCSGFVAPSLHRILLRSYNFLARHATVPIWGLPSKVILHIWTWVYYILPETVYQFLFMRYLGAMIKPSRNWDIVFPQNGIAGMIWAKGLQRRAGGSIAYTGHGGIGRGELLVLKHQPDIYIAISTLAGIWASKYSKSVTVIPNGVSVDKFFNSAGRKRPANRVLSVGALTAFKRHELSIKAISLIPNVYLMIVGEGELKDDLVNLCEESIPGRYEIISLPYSKIAAVYHDATIFVLPSLNEPMGIVYLEALSAGLPIVAPDDEVRREILGPYAIYTAVNDPHQYSEAIKVALTINPETEKRIGYVNDNFSWNNISKKYDEALKQFIGSK